MNIDDITKDKESEGVLTARKGWVVLEGSPFNPRGVDEQNFENYHPSENIKCAARASESG